MSKFDELVDRLCKEMRTGFSEVQEKIGQTNEGLEQFRAEVSGKLDGISSFLLKSEDNVLRLQKRIDKIETRLERLEERDRPA